MEKQFLITISSQSEHLYGVRFFCSFFSSMAGCRVTLVHVWNPGGDDMKNVLSGMWNDPEQCKEQLPAGSRRAINKSRELITGNQMSVEHILTRAVRERYGIVKDILTENTQGLYDAIILGRRESYNLQWMFEKPADKTVKSIIRDNRSMTPVWICPASEPGRKNVLLCIDGSQNSARAVDHVGYILSDYNQHSVTLFHVKNLPGSGSDAIFQQAEAILHEYGINDERIKRHSTSGLSVPGAILAEIERGGYGAVAVGMYGENRGRVKDSRLAGKTTGKLINRIEKASLWCCP
jgi:nucleotide-binding universal stress UspA family protein